MEAGVGAGVLVVGAVGVEQVDHRQLVPQTGLVVVRVVGGGDLDAAGAELRVDQDGSAMIGIVPSGQRQRHLLADQVLEARVVGMDGDRGVAEHCLGPRRGDVQRLTADRACNGVPDRPELALDLLVVDLVVGDGGAQVGVPVDQPLAAVDLVVLEEPEERLADGPGADSSRVNRVRSQSQEQPIRRNWLRMRFSYSSFQAQIRATSASRPRSWRVFFSSSSSRFSTTAWVAMPAWSVPGIQSAS